MKPTVFITCTNFQLRDELRAEMCAVADKLLHLELYVVNVRLTLESDYDGKSTILYRASLLVELRKSEIIVCAQAELPMPAVKSAVDQAERQLLELLYRRQTEEQAGAARSPTLGKSALAS